MARRGELPLEAAAKAVQAAADAVQNAARSQALMADALKASAEAVKACAETRDLRRSVGGIGFEVQQRADDS